jgi:hypothetical protein
MLSSMANFLACKEKPALSSVNISRAERFLAMLVRSSLSLVCSRSSLALRANYIITMKVIR